MMQKKLTIFTPDVNGNIDVTDQHLTSLQGSPREVRGHFNCGHNKLTTLKYGPTKVDGNFLCMYNRLTDLTYMPRFVGNHLDCHNNQITSLRDIHKHITYIGNCFSIATYGVSVPTHLLGLCLIDGIQRVDLCYEVRNQLDFIFNSVFTETKDKSERLLRVQELLLDAGYGQQARL